jgi:2-succinyl-5-enolpyruvyl-6-hydroxy-3-cyclohexene-1-carboxylate synthase
MPVRDLEWYAPPRDEPPTVFSNRGANGIDGVVSTAMGVAASEGGPVVALVGDLAFLHDLSAFVRPAGQQGSLTVVVVDNGGGAIFSFLPQRTALSHETFELLYGTPQLPDVASVARGLGLDVFDVQSTAEFCKALTESLTSGRIMVIRVQVPDRDTNVSNHEALNAAALDQVTGALPRP